MKGVAGAGAGAGADQALVVLDAVVGEAVEAALPALQRAGRCLVLERVPPAALMRADGAVLARTLAELLTEAASMAPRGAVINLAVRHAAVDMLAVGVGVGGREQLLWIENAGFRAPPPTA